MPPAVRHRIEDSRKEEHRKARSEMKGPKAWQCISCGHISSAYAAAERHADAHGHPRIEILFGLDESDDG